MSESLQGRPVSTRVPAPALAFTRGLVRAGDGAVVAVLLYGSQLHRSSPGLHSAWDLVVLVREYDAFHRAMRRSGHQRRSVALMNILGRILPPYVTDFSPAEAEGGIAKCLVLTEDQFLLALGGGARDHFLKGRMVQHVEVVWTRGEDDGRRIQQALSDARRDVLRWAGPFLEVPFDVEDLTRGMLQVSFAGEVRPESGDRASEVWASQSGWLAGAFSDVLAEASAEGVLQQVDDSHFRFSSPPGSGARRALKRYFFRSKARTTARWFKHVLTFNDWLTYIQRKAERRTGLTIELTRAERRWPLIFLWPKALRVLRHGKGQSHDTEQIQ